MVLGNYHDQFEEFLSNQMRYIFVEMEQLQKDYKKKWLCRLQKEVLLHNLYTAVFEENGKNQESDC